MQPVILRDHAVLTGLQLMPATSSDPLRIGEWLVDPRDDTLTRGIEKVKVEPRTMRLLIRLAQTPGAVVSQDELLESVWSGVVVGTASVYQSMSQLRKVLGDTEDPPRYIETVARKGYRLLAPVAPVPLSPRALAANFVTGAQEPAPAPQIGNAGVAPRTWNWRWVALAAAVTLVVIAAFWRFAMQPEPTLEMASIVVLPFVDLTAEKNEQVFCDGLSEETSNWLAQIPTLRVVARTSAFSYRKSAADARTIGRELHISHLLEGSLRRSGNRMRFTVQLIDTRTGFQIWSHSYPVEVGDVLSVQEQVARSVASNLELRITADTEHQFDGRRSGSGEALRLYLIAKSHAAKLDGPSNEQAIALYRQAIEADPGFALAKVWLARAIANRHFFNSQTIEQLAPEIEPLLVDVAKTTPQLSDLYVVRGGFFNLMRQRDAALRDLRHALELNPNSVGAASGLGYYYLTAGQPRDALTYYTMAELLDPRDYTGDVYRCKALIDLGQFSAAEAACENARALEPESSWVYSVSSSLEASRGAFDLAVKWSDAALERGGDTAALHGQRAGWLVEIGMLSEAGRAYQRALTENAQATRRDVTMTFVGAMAAIDAGGAPALHSFTRENGLADSSDPLLLFELANAELLVGENKLARGYVDRALASPALQPEDLASPWAARVGSSYLLTVAAVLKSAGDASGAQRRLDELAAVLAGLKAAGVETHGLYALKAQLAAMRGKPDEAMSELRRAVALGWSEEWLAERQVYFESLRSRSDFRELLAAVRAKNAATAAKLGPRLSVGFFGRPGFPRPGGSLTVESLQEDIHRAGHLVAPERVVIPVSGDRIVVVVVGPSGVLEQLHEHYRG